MVIYRYWNYDTRGFAEFLNEMEKGCGMCIYKGQEICAVTDCIEGRVLWLNSEREDSSDTHTKDIT